jgi:hypothetical protein
MSFRSVFTAGLFDGQTIIVTGGGSGIGRCTAHELAVLGASVALVGRDAGKLAAVQREITEDGGKATTHVCDIRDEAVVGATIDAILSASGRIDGLVNNAGGQYRAGEPISAQRALAANMVSRVVPHDELMATAEDVVARILRNDRRAVESAKETIFEVIGRTLDEQLKVECLFGYALCGGNPAVEQRSKAFLDKQDKGRAGATANKL